MKLLDQISLWYAQKQSAVHYSDNLFSLQTHPFKIGLLVDFNSSNTQLITQLKQQCKKLADQTTVWTFHKNSGQKDRKSDASLNYTDLSITGHIKANISMDEIAACHVLVNLLTDTHPRVECFIQRLPTHLKVRFDLEYQKNYNFIVPIVTDGALEKLNKFIQVYQTLAK